MNEGVRPGAVVLVDTNVIIEAHRTGVWGTLVGAYSVETVEDCVTETQTGFQRQTREQRVEDIERVELAVRASDIALDRSEESLWAHALLRTGMWFLCGPDRASLRVGVRFGLRDRLVSMEELLEKAGFQPRPNIGPAYTRTWMNRALSEIVVAEIGR